MASPPIVRTCAPQTVTLTQALEDPAQHLEERTRADVDECAVYSTAELGCGNASCVNVDGAYACVSDTAAQLKGLGSDADVSCITHREVCHAEAACVTSADGAGEQVHHCECQGLWVGDGLACTLNQTLTECQSLCGCTTASTTMGLNGAKWWVSVSGVVPKDTPTSP